MGEMTIASILGIPFDLIDYQAAMDQIQWWRRSQQRGYVTLTNAHGVMISRRDCQMHQALRQADLVLPDGVSIVLAAKLLGLDHSGRVTGPTLMLRLCQWGLDKGYRHFFYGGQEGIAQRLAERLQERFPGLQVAGTYCPPFRELGADEDQRIVRMINDTRPDVVWVGLGAPKQEKWMAQHAGRIAATAMIGVGAAFDFHSGNAKWAPAWIRALGLEWAYRLVLNPRRMWRRNLGNGLFVLNLLGQALQRIAGPSPESILDAGPAVGPSTVSFPRAAGTGKQVRERHQPAVGSDRKAA
jgi:N-acetylglucosaminyldiphosphoundecaprenol N-acetyl-beta-D-mannosaminyltransferase